MPKVFVNGINLYYEDHGSGFPILLTHAYAYTSAMWAPQVPVFSQKYRVITLDVRGHGQTDSPEDPEQYSREIVVEDVYQLLQHLGVRQAVIGGLSMGGIISQNFYFHHPEMTRSLLLCNTGPGFRNKAHMAEDDERRRESIRLLETEGMEGFIRTRGPDSYVPLEVLRQQNPIGLAGIQRGVFSNNTMLPLEEFRVPTLIISSTQDTNLIPAAEVMKRHIPGSLLCMIPNAGHCSNVDQPELFSGIVLQWLAEQGI